MMRAEDCLGMVLGWTCTQGSLIVLPMIFGMSMTPTIKYLQFAHHIIVIVLWNNNNAKISMLSHHQLEEFRWLITEQHQTLQDVWSIMDGLKIRIKQAPNFIT